MDYCYENYRRYQSICLQIERPKTCLVYNKTWHQCLTLYTQTRINNTSGVLPQYKVD